MHIVKTNNRYQFYNELNIVSKLEPQNYSFKLDEDFNTAWIEDAPEFGMPDRIYDVNAPFIDLIKKTYKDGKGNIGILLTGNKGQGKSFCAKEICIALNLPVILISKPIPRTFNFVDYISKIEQDHVLFIDEFEKNFKDRHSQADQNQNYHTQESFLAYMDGSLTTKNRVIFLFTTNDTVNTFLLNRPSRVRFLKEYNEMDEALVEAIINDKLKYPKYKDDLLANISMVNINIDLLISIIDDINLYDKPFSEFSQFYNYVFEKYRYEVFVTGRDGKEKFDKFVSLDRKPKATDDWINHTQVRNMVQFKTDEIIFESTEWDDKDDEEFTVTYRLVKMKIGASTRVFLA